MRLHQTNASATFNPPLTQLTRAIAIILKYMENVPVIYAKENRIKIEVDKKLIFCNKRCRSVIIRRESSKYSFINFTLEIDISQRKIVFKYGST